MRDQHQLRCRSAGIGLPSQLYRFVCLLMHLVVLFFARVLSSPATGLPNRRWWLRVLCSRLQRERAMTQSSQFYFNVVNGDTTSIQTGRSYPVLLKSAFRHCGGWEQSSKKPTAIFHGTARPGRYG
jgi:hypothetical protein